MVAYKTKATFYLASVPVVEWLATFNQKKQGKGERSCPLFSGNPSRSYHIECSARHRICRKRGSGEGRTTV